MGQEITNTEFSETDFTVFKQRLTQQTQTLEAWFEEKRFQESEPRAGFELEAWLIDRDFQPAGRNREFLRAMDVDYICPELANFNIEFNYTPQSLKGRGLALMQEEMTRHWEDAQDGARQLDLQLGMMGILPTVKNTDLVTANISALHRYQALNEQVLRLREGRPLELDIQGEERLTSQHQDVMLESATTSFQVHFQVPLDLSRRIYNASLIASAPVVAIGANSPFLFGKSLWAETRIPLFEQSVAVGGYEQGSHGPMRRVTFGSGYVRKHLFECFQENLEHYPVLLPVDLENEQDIFSYVRLHNGTLWRWNRPLIGDEDNGYHLRIEHRVIPAGPSIVDSIANAALYYGLVYALARQEIAPEHELSFALVRDNFYAAAKRGLDSQLTWKRGDKTGVQSLVLRELLPLAWDGLDQLGVNSDCIKQYLGIIEQRVKNHCNGATWQQAFVAKHGADMANLTKAYLERQNSGCAVHEWGL